MNESSENMTVEDQDHDSHASNSPKPIVIIITASSVMIVALIVLVGYIINRRKLAKNNGYAIRDQAAHQISTQNIYFPSSTNQMVNNPLKQLSPIIETSEMSSTEYSFKTHYLSSITPSESNESASEADFTAQHQQSEESMEFKSNDDSFDSESYSITH